MYFAIFRYIGEQDAQAERNCQEALDGAAQGACPLFLIESLFAEEFDGAIVSTQDKPLLKQPRSKIVHLEARDCYGLIVVQWVEDDDFINTVEEFRAEGLTHP